MKMAFVNKNGEYKKNIAKIREKKVIKEKNG